jgi:anthranilate phosphoribosyltransferase
MVEERKKEIAFRVKVKGQEELQDAADIIRDIMPNITIRDNQEVNVYLNICHVGGDHEQADT